MHTPPRAGQQQQQHSPKELVRLRGLRRAQAGGDGLRREGLRVGLAAHLHLRLLEVALGRADLAAEEARDAARGEDVRGRERGVRELLGVEGVRVRVGVLAGREPDRGLDELQEEVILGPALRAVVLLAREVGAVDGEVDLNGVCDTGWGEGASAREGGAGTASREGA